MGYTVVRTIYKLVFEDRPGMEVRTRGASVGAFTDLLGLAGVAKADPSVQTGQDTDNGEEVAKAIKDLLERFAEILVDWNLEEENGAPIPATLAGLRSLEFPFVLEIIMAWINTVSDVPAPLVRSSTPGEMEAVAASLQMETLSPSPLSSLAPS